MPLAKDLEVVATPLVLAMLEVAITHVVTLSVVVVEAATTCVVDEEAIHLEDMTTREAPLLAPLVVA